MRAGRRRQRQSEMEDGINKEVMERGRVALTETFKVMEI